MNNQLVSIIIPTYNRASIVIETLDSIKSQTYSNWECIIVDDGSTDKTPELLRDYCSKDKRFKYYLRPENRGKGANTCRNYGFELCKGEYVNWFDDDDIMLPDFLLEKVRCFIDGIDLVICSGYYVDNNLENKNKVDFNKTENLFKDYILWKLHVLTPSILFRKSFLNDKELFSVTLKRGQETYFFSRLFYNLAYDQFILLGKNLFLYRQHISSKTALDKEGYQPDFVKSKTVIMFKNLDRAFQINDIELKKALIKNLLYFFFRGVENKDYKNSEAILKKLPKFLFKNNIVFMIKFKALGKLLVLLQRPSYRVERLIMNYKIQ